MNGVSETFSVFWQQSKPLFMQPYLGHVIFLGFVSFLLMFVVHGQMLWFPQILAIYLNNNDGTLPKSICESISLENLSKNLTSDSIRLVKLCEGIYVF